MMKKTPDLTSAKRFLEGVPLPVVAAVSGGLDSMCLLHLLSTWGRAHNMEVTAAHFNHQLRGQSADRDEAFVQRICAEWNIPCVCGRGDTPAYAEREGLSIEEAARTLRYEFLERTRQQGGQATILTAHHADDNAETLLLNLLRGTGLRGLTGIPAFRDNIARPFLKVTREDLIAYAKEHNVPHVEDETNLLDDAARNVLRHQVLPVLKELNPRAAENMTRTAELLAQDERALEVEAGRLLHEAHVEQGVRAELPLAACKGPSKAVLSRVVWSMLCSVGGHQKDLTAAHVNAVMALIRGNPGREVSLPYGMTALRGQGTLVIFRRMPLSDAVAIAPGETVTLGSWTVTLGTAPQADGSSYALQNVEGLCVTIWRSGDRMMLPGSRGERSLKRLCADAGVQSWQRDTMPVLRAGEQVVAVPGIGVDLKFLPQDEEAAIYVTFHH